MSDDRVPWAVYEHAEGVAWHVSPPTRKKAREEARLAGQGHEAMPSRWASAMSNAWNRGRFAGIQYVRDQIDAETFCPRCFAGTESSEHGQKCGFTS